MIRRLARSIYRSHMHNIDKTCTLDEIKHRRYHLPDEASERAQKTHKSNAILNIQRMKVVELDADVARCSVSL